MHSANSAGSADAAITRLELPWLPRFLKLRQDVMKLKSPPELELLPELRQSIEAIAYSDSAREGLDGKPDVKLDRNRIELGIWMACLRSNARLILRAALVSVGAAGLASAATLLGMEILKGSRPLSERLGFAAAVFSLNIAHQIVTLVSNRMRIYVGLATETRLVGLLSHKLLRMSPRRRAAHSSGNLKVLITSDVKNVGTFFDNMVRNFIPALAALCVIGPILARLAGWAGITGIIAMAAIIPIAFALAQLNTVYQDRTQKEEDKIATVAGEWVKNIRLIRFLSWQSEIEREMQASVRSFSLEAVKLHLVACFVFGLSHSWWMLSIAAVAWVSAHGQTHVQLIPFFGAMWLLNYLASYFTHLPNTIRYFATAQASVRRIGKVLSEDERTDDFISEAKADTRSREVPGKPTAVHFKDVTFAFEGREPVLKGFSASFFAGEKVAILGEVGCGKTTLLRMICGELPPTSGKVEVEFDGGETAALWTESNYQAFRSTLAYVPQEPFVSNDTLGSNISLSDGDDDRAVFASAERAELEADLAQFSRGIHEEIGENGVNLSGGQRQRLNLARALHSGRPFLVLDDTLSAVDPRTEEILMRQLVSHPGGVILVTHRVGELMKMDRVIVIRNGQVVEDGSPIALKGDPSSNFVRVLRAYEEEARHGS